MQVPVERGVLQHCKGQIFACLVTAVYDHSIVLNHRVMPVCSTSVHAGRRSWCPHPLTFGNLVLSSPGHMSLSKSLLRALLWVPLSSGWRCWLSSEVTGVVNPSTSTPWSLGRVDFGVVLEAWRAVRGWVCLACNLLYLLNDYKE